MSKQYEVEVWCVAEMNPDFGSRMIMKFTKRPFSHVLFYYEDRDNKFKIAHAVAPAVKKEKPEYTDEMLKDHIIVYKQKIKLNCTKEYFCGYVNGSEE